MTKSSFQRSFVMPVVRYMRGFWLTRGLLNHSSVNTNHLKRIFDKDSTSHHFKIYNKLNYNRNKNKFMPWIGWNVEWTNFVNRRYCFIKQLKTHNCRVFTVGSHYCVKLTLTKRNFPQCKPQLYLDFSEAEARQNATQYRKTIKWKCQVADIMYKPRSICSCVALVRWSVCWQTVHRVFRRVCSWIRQRTWHCCEHTHNCSPSSSACWRWLWVTELWHTEHLRSPT